MGGHDVFCRQCPLCFATRKVISSGALLFLTRTFVGRAPSDSDEEYRRWWWWWCPLFCFYLFCCTSLRLCEGCLESTEVFFGLALEVCRCFVALPWKYGSIFLPFGESISGEVGGGGSYCRGWCNVLVQISGECSRLPTEECGRRPTEGFGPMWPLPPVICLARVLCASRRWTWGREKKKTAFLVVLAVSTERRYTFSAAVSAVSAVPAVGAVGVAVGAPLIAVASAVAVVFLWLLLLLLLLPLRSLALFSLLLLLIHGCMQHSAGDNCQERVSICFYSGNSRHRSSRRWPPERLLSFSPVLIYRHTVGVAGHR